MTSKPKLNQPDVESTITSPIGESLNINYTIPSKQFEQVFEKDTNIEKRNLTLEAVKKEWEELGWYWHYFYNENGIANKYRITKYVPSRKRDGSGDYQLEIYLCNNTKTFNINFHMDMQEYQLLTKTFKALGWGGYND